MPNLRRNPPSDDFAETKLKLQWAEARIIELGHLRQRLIEENANLKAEIADILDDREGEGYEPPS